MSRHGNGDDSAHRQTGFDLLSTFLGFGPAVFRPQVVPEEKRTVVARVKQKDEPVKREVLCCGQCDKWTPEGPGCYGYSLDGTKHYYGTCRYTGLPCKDNHFCSYARLRKE